MIAELMKELRFGSGKDVEGAIICQFQVQSFRSRWRLTRSCKHLADLDSACPGFAGKRNLGIGTGWC